MRDRRLGLVKLKFKTLENKVEENTNCGEKAEWLKTVYNEIITNSYREVNRY